MPPGFLKTCETQTIFHMLSIHSVYDQEDKCMFLPHSGKTSQGYQKLSSNVGPQIISRGVFLKSIRKWHFHFLLKQFSTWFCYISISQAFLTCTFFQKTNQKCSFGLCHLLTFVNRNGERGGGLVFLNVYLNQLCFLK